MSPVSPFRRKQARLEQWESCLSSSPRARDWHAHHAQRDPLPQDRPAPTARPAPASLDSASSPPDASTTKRRELERRRARAATLGASPQHSAVPLSAEGVVAPQLDAAAVDPSVAAWVAEAHEAALAHTLC